MVSKWTLGRSVGGWSGFTWLRIVIVGGLLWMWWWTLGFWRHGVRKPRVSSVHGFTQIFLANVNYIKYTTAFFRNPSRSLIITTLIIKRYRLYSLSYWQRR
jgi:hypothetical protein